MLAVQPSPTTPRFAFSTDDEVRIRDISYRPHERRPEGYILRRSDGSGMAEFFDNGKLAHLVQKGVLRHEPEAFLSEAARRRNATPSSVLSAAPEPIAHRLKLRLAYVEAFLELEALGRIKRTDEAIKAAMRPLQGRATEILGLQNREERADRNVCVLAKPVSPSSLRRWLKAYEQEGIEGLLDALHRSGNRDRKIGIEELRVMRPLVERYARENVPKEIIVTDVTRAFETLNKDRARMNRAPLEAPSRETIRREIGRLDPYRVHVAHFGEASARKKFAPVGKGLQLTRPLERVEMDEWEMDIFTECEVSKLLEHLTEDEKKALGYERKKIRWKASVAICATTRCIVAMRLTRTSTSQAAIQTIDMITRDKGLWKDTFSALSPWDMSGVPELIVTDCGSNYVSYETRAAMRDLGIRVERAPAGFPEMRPRIERVFRTMITRLVARLPGRTLSGEIRNGDVDPEAGAALTTEEVSEALVRWVVDDYHNTPHEGLGGETPANCWARLMKEYGVRPAPDLRRRRLVFGGRFKRKVQKKGIRILGAWYHSEELARWRVHTHDPEVEVRWYHEDIGAIEVNIDGTWIEVPSVLSELRGLRAEVWLQTVKEMRASFSRQAEITRPIVRQAIRDIEALKDAAMRRQGLVVQDWSDEQLRKMEDRLMIGFDVPDGDDDDAAAAPQGSTDGFGTVLPTAGHRESHDDPAAWKNFPDPVSNSKNWIPCPPQAPNTAPNGPAENGTTTWSNEEK